jgi:hypothetical protein
MFKLYTKNAKKYIIYIALMLLTTGIVYYAYKNIYNNKNENQFYIYTEHFLSQEDFNVLQYELNNYNDALNLSEEKTDRMVRYNLVIDMNVSQPSVHPVTTILNKYQEKIRNLTQRPSLYLAKNFPIEYRKYTKGSFMNKHKDTLIYKIPQYECILTLANTTDSVTIMGENERIKAQANSLMIVRALGVEHEVTEVSQGERTFLKFIFTETDELA